MLQKELKNETSDENEVLVEDLSSPDPDNNLASDLPLTVGITYQCSSDNNPVSIAGNIGEVTEVRKQIKMITYEEKTGPSESSFAATSATRKV